MALIEINRNPEPWQLRLFSGIGFPVLCAIVGALLRWKFSAPDAALAIWIAGAALGVLGLIAPPLIKPLYIGLMYACYPLAWVSSHLAMALLYYLVITPLGILVRAIKGDPLARQADPNATSYWQPRSQRDKMEEYFKQH